MITNRQKMPWHLIFLVLGALIGPGSVLLSGRDRWDGVIGDYLVHSGNVAGLGDWLQDSGWWLLWVLMRAMVWLVPHTGIDYWVTLKIGTAAVMLWIAYETFRLARDVFRMDEAQGCWAAALVLAFPGYVLFHSSCHIGVGLFLAFALAGYRLTLAGNLLRPLVGVVLIALSFQMNSNLVLVPALEAARWVMAGRVSRPDRIRMAGLLGLSVVGYVVLRFLIGSSGIYSEQGYNRILWPTSLEAVRKLAAASVLWATWLPLLLTGPVIAWALSFSGRPKGGHPAVAANGTLPARQLSASLLLCVAAVIAYVAAGKFAAFFVPTLLGAGGSVYATFAMEFRPGAFFSGLASPQIRHSIILGPMLAIAMVAVCIYAAGRWRSTRMTSASTLSLMLAACWLNLAGWALWAHSEKLVQGATDQAVVNALRQLPPPPDGASVLIERRQHQKDWTGVLETNFMLYEAYGRAAWVGHTVFRSGGPSYVMAEQLIADHKDAFARWAPIKDISVFHVAGDFVDSKCTAGYVFDVARPSAMDLFWRMPFAPASVAPATLVSSTRQCPKV